MVESFDCHVVFDDFNNIRVKPADSHKKLALLEDEFKKQKAKGKAELEYLSSFLEQLKKQDGISPLTFTEGLSTIAKLILDDIKDPENYTDPTEEVLKMKSIDIVEDFTIISCIIEKGGEEGSEVLPRVLFQEGKEKVYAEVIFNDSIHFMGCYHGVINDSHFTVIILTDKCTEITLEEEIIEGEAQPQEESEENKAIIRRNWWVGKYNEILGNFKGLNEKLKEGKLQADEYESALLKVS